MFRSLHILCFIFMLPLFLPAAGQPMVKNLNVEYQTDPVGIDVATPRLSWMCGTTGYDLRQSAYQILVASSPEKLEADAADVWNSGRVSSDRSVLVAYGGPPLSSRRRYYWKVRVWDGQGRASPYSQAAFWEMGLTRQTDWKAAWISAPKVYDWKRFVSRRKLLITGGVKERPAAAPEFRKSFYCTKKIARARLYISGLGYNMPYLNGKRVGNRLLDPAFTRYDRRVLYTTYDVTAGLRDGENVIGVVLGNGWYNMVTRAVWGFDHAPWRNDPALLAQLEIVYRDGSLQVVCSDSSWRVAPGPVVFNSVRQGECYDARKETHGWSKPGYSDTAWYPPRTVAGPRGRLKSQMLPPVRITGEVTPRSVAEPRPGVYVFDLGRDIAGFAKIRVHAPAGTRITLKYSERLGPAGLVDQHDVAQHVADSFVQTDRYVCKGEGTETWHAAFAYYGFRYVQVEGLPRRPDKGTITGLILHTAFDSAGSFTCSSPLLNRIQQATLHSYCSNFMGYPTDCPQREKNGWTGDAHLAAETGLYNFESQNGYIKWLGDIADEQRSSGALSAIVPSSGWGYFWGNGPAWDNAMVLIPWYLYTYCGDRSILSRMYPHIRRYVDYLSQRAHGHLVSFGLGDWAPAATKTSPEITSTAYYYVDAGLLARMAGILGFQADSVRYGLLADSIRVAFNRRYYKGDGIYGSGSQTALACALYQGLAGDHTAATVAALVAAVHARNDHLDCGILGTKYLLHALSDNGHAALAYKVVNQRTFPGWGYWMQQGATTLWEQWDGSESRNHIMFGDVSAWFYETLAGIRPAAPGFKCISFTPYFAPDLNHVDASHRSPYGVVTAGWTRTGNHVRYTIVIPANTTGMVTLPAAKVLVNGRTATTSPRVKDLHRRKGTVGFTLGSGRYTLVLKDPVRTRGEGVRRKGNQKGVQR